MRPPDLEELIIGLLVFLLVLPMAYWFMKALFALILGL